MDIKIRFTKKTAFILQGLVLCGLMAWGCWNFSTFKARREIKSTCQGDCGCFNNVVDYRLTNEQVRLFAQFMKELKLRPTASILEFMDTLEAVNLQKAFAICRPAPEPEPAPQAVEPPVPPKNKKK